MTIRHDVQPEDLIRYSDGDLHGGRRELVEAHLQHCPACQRWLADFEDTRRLLRESTPPVDSTAARARIMVRIAAEPGRRRDQRVRPRAFIALVSLTVALLVALAFPWQRSEARVSVGRFFQFVERGSFRSALQGGATPTIAPRPAPQPLSPEGLMALPFSPQIAQALPLGLRLERGVIANGNELALYYRNDRGLVMLLTQRRSANVKSSRPTGSGQLTIIGGVEAVVQTEPRTGTVGVMTWEDHGILYELSADKAPEGRPSMDEARQLVEALLTGR